MSDILKKLYAQACATPGLEHTELQISNDMQGRTVLAVDGEEAGPDQYDEDVSAAERITAVVNAVSDAQDTAVLVDEAQSVTEGLEGLINAIQVMNRNGGMPVGAFALAQQASERYAARLNIDAPLINTALESFGEAADGRATVSTAGLESILTQLKASEPALAKQSQRTMGEMIDALRKAIPDAAEKLQQFRGDLELSSKDPEGSVSVDQGTYSALAVDGTVPEDLVTFFASYSQLGNMLFHEYSRVAQKGAEQTAGLVGRLNFDNPEGFWATLGAASETIDDPRKLIPVDQLSMALPGGGPLFEGPCTDLPGSQDIFAKLTEFVKSYAPVIQADVPVEHPGTEDDATGLPDDVAAAAGADTAAAEPVTDPAAPTPDAGAEDAGGTTTVKALTRQQLRTIAESLKSLLCDDGVDKALSSIAASWGPSEAALHEAREALNSMTGTVPEALGARTQIVARYIETLHRLAIWPQVNFVANLIYTVNAFVAFGTQVLTGESVSEEASEAEVAADETDAAANLAVDQATDEVSVVTADEAAVQDSTLAPAAAEAAIDGQADAVAAGTAEEMGDPITEAEQVADEQGDAGTSDPAADTAADPLADDGAGADDGTGDPAAALDENTDPVAAAGTGEGDTTTATGEEEEEDDGGNADDLDPNAQV